MFYSTAILEEFKAYKSDLFSNEIIFQLKSHPFQNGFKYFKLF
jgi:hypothetical protein